MSLSAFEQMVNAAVNQMSQRIIALEKALISKNLLDFNDIIEEVSNVEDAANNYTKVEAVEKGDCVRVVVTNKDGVPHRYRVDCVGKEIDDEKFNQLQKSLIGKVSGETFKDNSFFESESEVLIERVSRRITDA